MRLVDSQRRGGSRVLSCVFGPFSCALEVVGFVRERSHHFCGPRRPSGSFRCIHFNPVCLGVPSGAVGPFPCALGIVGCERSISVCPEGRRVRSGAFGPFSSDLVVVGFVQVRSVHSCVPWGSAVSYGCVRSIPVSCGRRGVGLGVFGPFSCALEVVVLFQVRSVHSRFVGMYQVRSVHSRTPWRSSGSFGSVRSIPVHPGGRQVRSGAFGPFTCALEVFGFVRVRSLHSPTPWVSLGCIRSIPVRPRDSMVGSFHSRAP